MGGMFRAGPERRADAEDRMDLSALEHDVDRRADASESGDEGDMYSVRAVQEQRRYPPRRPFAGARVATLSREEFDRLSREGKCFHCRQTGHLARNCPKAKAPSTPSKSGN